MRTGAGGAWAPAGSAGVCYIARGVVGVAAVSQHAGALDRLLTAGPRRLPAPERLPLVMRFTGGMGLGLATGTGLAPSTLQARLTCSALLLRAPRSAARGSCLSTLHVERTENSIAARPGAAAVVQELGGCADEGGR